MAERIILLREPLSAALYAARKGDLMPTDGEFVTLEQFIEIMKPVVEKTEAVGGEKWVTVSTIRPSLRKLLNDHLVCQSNDARLTKSMKIAMADDLHERYTEAALIFLDVSAFLDPRFKLPCYLGDDQKIPVLKHLEQEVEDNIAVKN